MGFLKLLGIPSGKILISFRKCSNRITLNTFAKRKANFGSLFPEKLLSKKKKTPDSLYLCTEDGAQTIMKSLDSYLPFCKHNTILEINPGIGLLTRHLLERDVFKNIILIESVEYFITRLLELYPMYSNKISLEYGDMANLWKLCYQDKLDKGTRVSDLLKSVPRKKYDEDPNMIVIGAVGSYSFFKHLISSLVFQTGLLSYGRPELFLVVPPPIYIHLTCNKEIGYLVYRSMSKLFQMFFEYRFITRIPREYFLPIQTELRITKSSKLGRLNSIDQQYMYLVKIVPRHNLHKLCAPHDLPALWYFTLQNCISHRNRIIPNMEKWVPGCGPRIIVNEEPSETLHLLYPNEDCEKLPKYSQPCTTLSCKNFFPEMNIFTEFGELNASEMLTLFTQFRSWPEYGESSFIASLENNLMKMETLEDEDSGDISEGNISIDSDETETIQDKKLNKAKPTDKLEINETLVEAKEKTNHNLATLE